MNKRGFTTEEQDELEKLFAIAALVARCVTEQVAGTIKDEAAAMMSLHQFIRRNYPRGPVHLKESLDNIARFCDLAIITSVEALDDSHQRP